MDDGDIVDCRHIKADLRAIPLDPLARGDNNWPES